VFSFLAHTVGKKLFTPLFLFAFVIARSYCSCALAIAMGCSLIFSGPVLVLRCPVLFNGTNYCDCVPHMHLHIRGLHLWELLTGELPYPLSPSVPTQPVISEKTTAAEKEMLIASVKVHLSDQLLMSDLGPLRYFLGIEISSTLVVFFLSQEEYIQDLLD
jgi:hypothetical protein